ncbi:pentatricopeptide repeat-containing protein At2g01860-like [Chenopodium quinoa]|uniref:pentatricopeptide repeat-containing protein At2g01860-like n=1 Tax=Chenopodium quinoa TaxID=63459 RepID=UPI000B781787|nr:pentatricopeptide repeat-containing protein At2g01860-like [Chenopodium quinoa]XP_021717731.1 pentatricopeptide repeat-containing protein At2g01860-like [Chenopodium quinoa]
MDSGFLRSRLHQPLPAVQIFTHKLIRNIKRVNLSKVYAKVHFDSAIHLRKPPKYLRYPRRTKLPPDFGIDTFIKSGNEVEEHLEMDAQIEWSSDDHVERVAFSDDENDEDKDEDERDVCEADEIEAISALFQGRIPQKPGKLNRRRPLPLPLPHKIRPLGLPTTKKHVRSSSPAALSRISISKQVYKDPVFLLNLAREIRNLPEEADVSCALNKWGRFLRKGSLSLTIRELGHMGFPDRALQTFCWAQKQTHLFPDDRILASTVEILARTHDLKLPFDLDKFVNLASRGVLEAIAKGFIKGGSLNLAWKLLSAARRGKRMLDSSIYVKLLSELGKNPDKNNLVVVLLEELGQRDNLNLNLQDCTAIMKVCIRLGNFDYVESLFDWFQQNGNQPSVVMYTTVIYSRLFAMKYRKALAVVWEMERINCHFDLPAYRVVIKLFVALNDLPRAVRYFSKIKEAGFSPTYDIYRDMISMYLLSGRFAKCKEVCKELELAGYKLDAELRSHLVQLDV